jgi:hypothetical protein
MDVFLFIVAFCLGMAVGVAALWQMQRPRFEAYDTDLTAAQATIAQFEARLAVPAAPVRAAEPPRPAVVITRADRLARVRRFVEEAALLAAQVPADTAAQAVLTDWTQRVQRWTADARGYLAEHCSIRAADMFIGGSESTRTAVPGVHVDLLNHLHTLQRRSRNLAALVEKPDSYLPE